MRGARVLCVVVAIAACSGDAGPSARRVQLEPFGPITFHTAPAAAMSELLAVRVADASTGHGTADVEVQWRVVSGTGSVAPIDARTDDFGVARARLTTGSEPGTVTVEANAAARVGAAPRYTVHVVAPPVIESITPSNAAAGEIVTIRGSSFGSDAGARHVRFGGVRGRLVGGSATELSVEVPACVPNGPVIVQVGVGGSISNGATLQAASPTSAARSLGVREMLTLRGEDLACARLLAPAGAGYLVITQNTHGVPLPGSPFELRGFHDGPGTVSLAQRSASLPAAGTASAAADWEFMLRAHEAQWGAADVPAAAPGGTDMPAAGLAQLPELGARRQFNVLKADLTFARVTAEVRHISQRAIIYQDVDAPSPVLSDGDYATFAALFDDPIHPTSINVFGEPSDIDGNGRVLILFTPQVNALTRPADAGYIAGFFYGCDLVERSRCSGTNRAEIFYMMVPDPDARFGKRRTRDDVMRSVPGVLAHEYQHMINFAQKGLSLDLLWLSEGLAHAAEDVVARALHARGDVFRAAEMFRSNTDRAREYMQRTAQTSLIGETSPGSLAMRGGAWLLVEYLAGHYGGDALLGSLTRAPGTGIASIEEQTGRAWGDLLADFAVALIAETSTLNAAPVHSFPRFDLRLRMGTVQPAVATYSTAGFADALALPSASHGYGVINTPAGAFAPDRTLSLVLAGLRGAPFPASASPQLVLVRVR